MSSLTWTNPEYCVWIVFYIDVDHQAEDTHFFVAFGLGPVYTFRVDS